MTHLLCHSYITRPSCHSYNTHLLCHSYKTHLLYHNYNNTPAMSQLQHTLTCYVTATTHSICHSYSTHLLHRSYDTATSQLHHKYNTGLTTSVTSPYYTIVTILNLLHHPTTSLTIQSLDITVTSPHSLSQLHTPIHHPTHCHSYTTPLHFCYMTSPHHIFSKIFVV